MTQFIPLSAHPNQTLSVRLAGALYEITLKTIGGILVATIVRNGETLIENSRVLPQTPIIPYSHLCPDGDFVFVNEDGKYPHWERLGGADRLYFIERPKSDEVGNG